MLTMPVRPELESAEGVVVDVGALYPYQKEFIRQHMRKYRPGPIMIAKYVAGLPGDEVTVCEGLLHVRRWVVPIVADKGGLAKDIKYKKYVIPSGHAVLLNPGLLSLDSRYLGPIPISAISGRWWPVPWPRKNIQALLTAQLKGKYPDRWLSPESMDVPGT